MVVKVNRAGVTLLYRDGYFARRELGPLQRRATIISSRIMAAAASDRAISDLPVKIDRASVEMAGPRGVAQVDITIDIGRMFFDVADDRHHGEVEVSVFCVDGRDGSVGASSQTLQLGYTEQRLAVVKQSGLKHSVMIPVTGRPANVKVVVYDYNADLVGSAISKVK